MAGKFFSKLGTGILVASSGYELGRHMNEPEKIETIVKTEKVTVPESSVSAEMLT